MPSEGRICPKCGYERQLRDLAPDYECPRCGIIYNKYVSPQQHSPETLPAADNVISTPMDPGEATVDVPLLSRLFKKEKEALEPASLLRRSLATIYTVSLIFLCIVPVKLFFYIIFRIVNSPESVRTFAFLSTAHSWETGYKMVICLLVLGIVLYRYLTSDSSWGQKKFGIVVRSAYSENDSPHREAKVLRILGNFVALISFPITLAGWLYSIVTKKPLIGIADRISSTRQYESGQPVLRFRQDLNRAFMPACIAMLVQFAVVGPLSAWIMSSYTQRPQSQTNRSFNAKSVSMSAEERAKMDQLQKERHEMRERLIQKMEADQGPNTLKVLTNLERRHLQELGDYTEDMEALINRYNMELRNNRHVLLIAAKEGNIRARKTAEGVELWVETTPGNWLHQELRK